MRDFLGPPVRDACGRFSIITNRRIHHAPIANRDAAEALMLVPSRAVSSRRTPSARHRQHQDRTSALRTCSRNTMQTNATTTLSSNNVCLSVGE